MPRRELNNATAVKKMTDFLGHSNIFATLSCANRQSTSFHTCANIRLSLQKCKGSLAIFVPIQITYPYNEEDYPDTRSHAVARRLHQGG